MFFKEVSSPSWELRRTLQICLVIVLTLKLALASDGNGKTLRFPPLPKEETYKLQPSAQKLDSANGLVGISAGIANILRDQPPYEIINEILSKSQGSINTKQVLDYEAPMISLAVISLIFGIAIPITGLIICCCRFAGKCGGSLNDNKDLDVRPTKKRKQFALALVFCSIFLIVGAVIILVSTSKMTETLPKAMTTVGNVFDDIVTYKNNTFKQMNHIVGPELLIVLDKVMQEILALGVDIVDPIIKEGGPLVINLVNSITKLDKDIETSLRLLGDVQRTVSTLVSDGESLKQALAESKRNISDAKRECTSLPQPQQACNSIPNEDLLAVEANFTQVPNITDTKEKVQEVVNTNLTHEADKSNKSFHELPNTVQNMASNFTSDFKNYSNQVKHIKIDFLRPLEDDVDKILEESVLPYQNEINKYLEPDGAVTKYDKYRNITYILIATLVFIIVFLTLLGITLGMTGASTFDTPSTRGDMSDLGGRILIGAATFSVFCAFFINILVAIVFLVGTNTSIVCRRVSDMELLKNTVDNPQVMNGYPLSKIFKNRSIELTFTHVLNECGENKAPWTVFKMDNRFNLTAKLNYRDKIPNLDAVFKDVNKTVADTSVMTDQANKGVNDSFDAGVQNINFTEYKEQTDKEIVQVSLTSFAENITKAANGTTGSVKLKLQATADSLVDIDKNTVQPTKQKSERLKGLVDNLQTKADDIVNNVQKIGVDYKAVKRFIVTDAVRIAKQGVKEHVNNVLDDIDQLLDHVISQVRYDIGRCKPIHNMYFSLTSTVCSDYFGNLNASWIGFGLCAVFTLLIIVLTVRAAKHFRRFHRADNFRDSDKWDDNLEMPWEASFEMNEPKHHLIVT